MKPAFSASRIACSRCAAIKTDVTADAFSSPPRIRVLDTEVVEPGDECRRTLETVLVDHQPMVPQRHGACQPSGLYSRAGG